MLGPGTLGFGSICLQGKAHVPDGARFLILGFPAFSQAPKFKNSYFSVFHFEQVYCAMGKSDDQKF